MRHVLQRGGEGVDELVGQLGQEADGVDVQHGHAAGQRARVDGDIQGGEQLVSGLQRRVARQRFDQGRLPWRGQRGGGRAMRLSGGAPGRGDSAVWCAVEACLTAVGVAHDGDDGEVSVFALGPDKVPLPPQALQSRPDLQISLLQQPLLHLQQSLALATGRRGGGGVSGKKKIC